MVSLKNVMHLVDVWNTVNIKLEQETFCNLEFNICGSVHHACSEIIPKRCNNCGLIFPNALLYMFRVTIPPIIRSTFAVYGQGKQAHLVSRYVRSKFVLSVWVVWSCRYSLSCCSASCLPLSGPISDCHPKHVE